MEYLGYVVSESGIQPCPGKVEAVQNWPTPMNVHDVRSFLGLCSYYRRFIPQFSEMAFAMVKLTRHDVDWEWGDSQRKAFQDLRNALVGEKVLAYPERRGLFILDTDASLCGMGAVLSQVQNGEE